MIEFRGNSVKQENQKKQLQREKAQIKREKEEEVSIIWSLLELHPNRFGNSYITSRFCA